ncbi:EamA family transporter [Naasia sp. SYSU D00948]|uniref:EamA family transporter n=1 Tax=Naasia sp. SYSU D00948 TaxID=2817379 RepID=UPI001B3017B0|nr:EamA family transporter [Naasia sp. SYSU D00948]
MSALLAALFGVAGAIVYGAADFFGGLASRHIGAVRAAALAALSGLVVLVLALPLLGGHWSTEALLTGALSGVAGAVALSLLYACLAIGPMSVLAPITALVSAVVPMGWGFVLGERVGPLGSIGLAAALVAVVLVALVPERTAARATLRGVAMAVGSGTMIGVFLVLLDAAPDDSGIVPLLANRTANALLMATAVAVLAIRHRSAPLRGPGRGLELALLCGALDAVANALLLAGVRTGELTVVSVLTALYPAGTIVLAALVLKERISRVQAAGLVLALGAAVLLALG